MVFATATVVLARALSRYVVRAGVSAGHEWPGSGCRLTRLLTRSLSRPPRLNRRHGVGSVCTRPGTVLPRWPSPSSGPGCSDCSPLAPLSPGWPLPSIGCTRVPGHRAALSLGCTGPSRVFVSVAFSGDGRLQDGAGGRPQGDWRRGWCSHLLPGRPPPQPCRGVRCPVLSSGGGGGGAVGTAGCLPAAWHCPLALAPIPSLAAPTLRQARGSEPGTPSPAGE